MAHCIPHTPVHCDPVDPVHCAPVAPVHCGPVAPARCTPELWITYHQASRTSKQVTAQLIDCGDGTHLYDLEDVIDHIFQQGYVDAKWRSVVWWEDCSSVRLKACTTVQDLLARGAGNTPETALHFVIGMSRTFFLAR
jgi:hypothetical protein